jgi:hypothetical protein
MPFPVIIDDDIEGVPIRYFVYDSEARMESANHSYFSPAKEYAYWIIAEPCPDMEADEFFASPFAYLEGQFWTAKTDLVGPEAWWNLLLKIQNHIREDIKSRKKWKELS